MSSIQCNLMNSNNLWLGFKSCSRHSSKRCAVRSAARGSSASSSEWSNVIHSCCRCSPSTHLSYFHIGGSQPHQMAVWTSLDFKHWAWKRLHYCFCYHGGIIEIWHGYCTSALYSSLFNGVCLITTNDAMRNLLIWGMCLLIRIFLGVFEWI